MPDTIFELKSVYFSYLNKFPALCDISLAINAGEKIAILGANGSGKSTLLQMLDGLIFPDSGAIKAFGHELKEDKFNDARFSGEFRRKVGLVFQNPDVQLFCPTVKEDILFGPLQLGFSKKKINDKFEEIVEMLQIKDLINRAPHQLSIGEKRKVAIATTLIIEPEVMLLDEPTAGLDPLTSRHIVDIIIEANIEGRTIITATHDLHIIEEISDKVYVFNRQKQIARCTGPEELLQDTEFLKENNLIHVHSHRHKDKVHTHTHYHIEHHH